MKVALFGKVEFDSYAGEITCCTRSSKSSPKTTMARAALHVGRVVPVYEAAGKLTTRVLRTITHRVLEMPPEEDCLPSIFAASSKCRIAGPPSATPTSRRPIPISAC
jgi:RecG-like helicase